MRSSRASRFEMSRWGRLGSRRDTVAITLLPFAPVGPQAPGRSQVTVQSTGRWTVPISGDGMLPESVKTLVEPRAVDKGKEVRAAQANTFSASTGEKVAAGRMRCRNSNRRAAKAQRRCDQTAASGHPEFVCLVRCSRGIVAYDPRAQRRRTSILRSSAKAEDGRDASIATAMARCR